MSSPIKIVAIVHIKPEYTEMLLPAFEKLVRASRAEEGNIHYDLHQEIGSPHHFVFVEGWKSQAAVDSHNASPHFQDFVQALDSKTDRLEIVMTHEIPFI